MRHSLLSTLLPMALAAGPAMADTKDHSLSGCSEDASSLHLAVAFLEDMDMAPAVIPCPRRVQDLRLARLYFDGVADGSAKETVAALYIPATGEILVDGTMNFQDPLDLSFFVHELVHTRQMEDTGTTACVGALEFEAYAIQAAFLRDRGFPREALLFDLIGQLQVGCASRY